MNAPAMAQLRTALEQAFAPTTLELIDDSAAHAGHAGSRSGGHYRVTIVAEAFRGRSPLERHRLVYAAVAALLSGGSVHALNIVARAPEESA
jgi:BolA protein